MDGIKPCSVGDFWHWEGGVCCCRTVAVVCSSGLFHAEHVKLQSLWGGKVRSSKPSSATEMCVTWTSWLVSLAHRSSWFFWNYVDYRFFKSFKFLFIIIGVHVCTLCRRVCVCVCARVHATVHVEVRRWLSRVVSSLLLWDWALKHRPSGLRGKCFIPEPSCWPRIVEFMR